MDTQQSSIATRLLVGLLALFGALLVIAADWIAGAAVALGLLGSALATAALGTVWIGSRSRRIHETKSSAELTMLSGRLLRLESRPAAEPQGDRQAGEPPAGDLQADVALLGRLVSSLAETVAAQEDSIAALRRELAEAGRQPVRHGEPIQAEPHRPDQSAPEPFAFRPAPATLETRDDFARAASTIIERLSRERAAPQPAPAAPPPPDFAPRQSYEPAVPADPPASSPGERPVLEALAAGAFDFVLQPIVTLPQRRTRLYDIKPRLIVEGLPLEAATILPILERHRCRSHLDLALVEHAGRIAEHLAGRDSPAAVVVPLDSASLLDREVLGRLARLVAPAPETAKRLVVALGQAAFRSLALNPDGAVGALRAAGVRFLLDPVDRLRTDWSEMARWGVDYIRLDAEHILDPDRRAAMVELRAALRAEGLALVASGVDEERYVPELLDDEVGLAIGSTLAPARPVKSDLGGMRTRPPESEMVPPADKPEPVPYRNVLRQAG